MSYTKPCVYLAGFDVFRHDSIERGKYLKSICAKYGLKGLYPIDNEIDPQLKGGESAQAICQANIAMIKRSNGIIANLNTFRGHEPDSGTVFEVGMAIALGIPVWAYFDDHRSLLDKVPNIEGWDRDELKVEDFELPQNLMLACTWRDACSDPEDAIAMASQYLLSQHSLS